MKVKVADFMLLFKKSGAMAQKIKLFVDKPAYLISVPGAPHGGRKEPTPASYCLMSRHIHLYHLQLVNKQKDLRKEVELSSHSESCFAF